MTTNYIKVNDTEIPMSYVNIDVLKDSRTLLCDLKLTSTTLCSLVEELNKQEYAKVVVVYNGSKYVCTNAYTDVLNYCDAASTARIKFANVSEIEEPKPHELHPYQMDAIGQSSQQEIFYSWGRRTGKTHALSYLALVYACSNPGSTVCIVSPYEKVMYNTKQELYSLLKEWPELQEKPKNLRELSFTNGSNVVLLCDVAPITPDSSTLILVEEPSYLSDDTLNNIRASQCNLRGSGKPKIRYFGTPCEKSLIQSLVDEGKIPCQHVSTVCSPTWTKAIEDDYKENLSIKEYKLQVHGRW